ncbi:peptidyl-prolyl cis-trans isomerase [Paludibacterium paludis]|uniref:Peptidyl-prolyl cis-trans isomerase n=2 Tax=Paludibacterium paludis TaxID=1225769 RepID=A0A918U7L3_9NEIS|nr:peptidyl-prolyl cis-trans isomerase [Paludibacterium paludis]
MKLTNWLLLPLALASSLACAAPVVRFETTLGAIEVTLDEHKAPRSVANFLGYVKSGFYDGTIFHRVIPGFVVQGGGFTPEMTEKPAGAPIPNESANRLSNLEGTIAMARTEAPDSATSQFYFNVANNSRLDYKAPTPGGWGYAVFGKVTRGMDVVKRISRVDTGVGQGMPDVPLTPVVLKKAVILKR